MKELAAQNPSHSAANAAGSGRVTTTEAGGKRLLCFLMLVPLYYVCTWVMKIRGGFVIENLSEHRRRYQEIAKEPGPLIICANHLTFIDSALILWTFGGGFWYLRNFARYSWNLPAGDFFKRKAFHRFMGTIAKCIFVYRNGSKAHKDSVIELCTHLVRAGEVVTVFPEGRRSRTGRFDPDALAHGVGKMVAGLGGSCRVLCVYLRGDKQDTYSNYPQRGSRFHVSTELIHVRTAKQGREGYAEVVSPIGRTLKAMEDRYFDQRPSPKAVD